MEVLLFARLREQAGVGIADLDLPAGSTARDAFDVLRLLHPAIDADPGRIRPARNREFCEWEAVLAADDELAFIPPVSGGLAAASLIEITIDPLDPRRLEAAVANPGAGAICTFTGVVRDNSDGVAVTHLEYEAYREMAELEMARIAHEIIQRWPDARVAMAHRTGRLEIGEASVVVSVSCPHRAEAFEACRQGIDRLKESAPIWKKEITEKGDSWREPQ